MKPLHVAAATRSPQKQRLFLGPPSVDDSTGGLGDRRLVLVAGEDNIPACHH
jgi:hypothetical protein